MRSLARDLGGATGTVAHIVELRRLTVGPFTEADAISLDSLETMGHSPAALEQVLPVETALDDIPALALSETEANRLRCGQAVRSEEHTSELQSLMRTSYAVFCLKKTKMTTPHTTTQQHTHE